MAPNISAWRRRTVGDLTGTLRIGHPQTSLPDLPATSSDSDAYLATLGCNISDFLGIHGGQAPYPLPDPQRMPTQERVVPGTTTA